MPMARIEKYHTGIVGVIKHNIREFKNGTCPTNMEVDPERTGENYSIISRGTTARDIESYRKKIENECFHYNRKNLVHANEVICTLPADCPTEQERLFFEESFRYICSTLPMGEKCVFLAEVHADEGRILKDGVTVAEGAKHLHVMYVPAVRDSKHEGFSFKLCSDELTKRPVLKKWHQNYQKWLNNAGIHATVASGVTSGNGISVKSLKEISKGTGLTLEQIRSLEKENKILHEKLMETERALAESNRTISRQDTIIQELRHFAERNMEKTETAKSSTSDYATDREKAWPQQKAEKNREPQQTREPENSPHEHTWGSHTWGNTHEWGSNGSTKSYEKERTL